MDSLQEGPGVVRNSLRAGQTEVSTTNRIVLKRHAGGEVAGEVY